jgi:RHS repeat-associated protein
MYFSVAYGPYGETYSRSGKAGFAFTGQESMTSGNLYDFPAREYGIQGRWPSPDPAGLVAVDTSDPQTLNRYAYVRNSPLQVVDPSGLEDCYPTSNNCDGGGFGGGGGCPPEICGDPLFGGGPCCGGPGGGGPPTSPIGNPVPMSPGTTAPTFPTGPGIDWSSLIFGPPDPALLIFNFCVNRSGTQVGCDSPDAYANCGESQSCAAAIGSGTFIGPPLPPWWPSSGPDNNHGYCSGGDAVCDSQGKVVQATANIVSDNAANLAMASAAGAAIDGSVEGLAEAMSFRKGSWLNTGQYFRIGFGRFGGNRVFRVFVFGFKWDIWKGGPLWATGQTSILVHRGKRISLLCSMIWSNLSLQH